MRLRNTWILAKVLLLAQLRSRGQRTFGEWYRKPSALLAINIVVFAGLFAIAYEAIKLVPSSILTQYGHLIVQGISIVPIITLSFVILYSILFLINESAQFATTDIVNYMPISSTEYVLASTLSTILMYFFILSAIVGVTLAIAIPLGILPLWAVSMGFSAFFMLIGGFVGEIIRSLVNRVSSSFSKRGGRSAIISRLVAIVLVIVLLNLFFNYSILFRVIQLFAPQIQSFWFVPLLWPSLAVSALYASNLSSALIFTALTVIFGLLLMLLGIFLRSRYWVPLPVTIKLGTGSKGGYRGPGILGRIGFSQAEAALIIKDFRSLSRRKEMARYLSFPVLFFVLIVLYSFIGISGTSSSGAFTSYAPLGALGATMFGLFISITNFGQEGPAIWNIYAAPLQPRSLLRAKIAMPLFVSIIPAVILPLSLSLIFRAGVFALFAFVVVTMFITVIADLVGAYLGPKYMDLEEKPRSSFATGTGILIGFVIAAVLGVFVISPLAFYLFLGNFAQAIGFNKFYALGASVVISIVFIAVFYLLASSNVKQVARELPY